MVVVIVAAVHGPEEVQTTVVTMTTRTDVEGGAEPVRGTDRFSMRTWKYSLRKAVLVTERLVYNLERELGNEKGKCGGRWLVV